jgi:predicted TIM-barrel fold metal-dependent hydrolase
MFDLGPRSNGEYFPYRPTPVTREAIRRLVVHADEHAPRHGLSRRQFLQTLCGAATTLVFLAACNRDESSSRGSEPGGTFDVPTSATTDPDAAADDLGGDEFIFDVQTHLLDFDLDEAGAGGGGFGLGFPYAACGEDDWRACFGVDHWLEELFLRSDTAMAVVSAVPILSTPNPLAIEVMEASREAAARVCGGEGRVFLHGQVNPNVGDVQVAFDGMRRLAAEHPIGAWKVYTHVPQARGWYLDDHDPEGVQCGQAFLDVVREVGPRVVCVHKGFGNNSKWSSPVDIGPAARANPDITFVVYHSGYDGPNEGPYTAETADVGVNRMLTSIGGAGIGVGGNVYAELGSTWWNAMRDTTQAAHVLGKLLAAVGDERVLWGTDSIWYGSPQDQIQAFRTFQISQQFQDTFGYPELTDVSKRRIFGQNAARLYGAEPVTAACQADPAALDEYRRALAPKQSYGPATYEEARDAMRAHGIAI